MFHQLREATPIHPKTSTVFCNSHTVDYFIQPFDTQDTIRVLARK